MKTLGSLLMLPFKALRVIVMEGPAEFWRKVRSRLKRTGAERQGVYAVKRGGEFGHNDRPPPRKKTDHKSIWDEGLLTQLDHWDRWLAGEFGPGPQTRLTDSFPFPDHLKKVLNCPAGSDVRVLDLGSGPASTVGRNWAGRKVVVTCVDPLAEEFNLLLSRHGYEEFTCIVRGCGETLLEDIEERGFDIAYSANALDHSYDPLLCINNMLRIVKPGGWVVFMVVENEGQRQNYGGLHKWNFCVQDGELVLWDQSGNSWVVAHEIGHSVIRDITTKEDQSRGDHIMVYIEPGSRRTEHEACHDPT